MKLFVFTAACLGTIFQTVCAAPTSPPRPLTHLPPGSAEANIYSHMVEPALEKSEGQVLRASFWFSPGYKANITLANKKVPKGRPDPLIMVLSGPDCPIAFGVTSGPRSPLSRRVFTQFTLQEASIPVEGNLNFRTLDFSFKYIPPQKKSGRAFDFGSYEVKFYRDKAKPPAEPYTFTYEKHIPSPILVNYLILQSEDIDKFPNMESGLQEDPGPDPEPKPAPEPESEPEPEPEPESKPESQPEPEPEHVPEDQPNTDESIEESLKEEDLPED
ncbi:hypothetical protein ABW20_dc0102055 [Dactylellina cionopaga]|nr:hypothetical protein ABW20_dc0102055 [Dactylellina cionopaga]